jgi:uncharacterized protein (DUF849 family)
VLQACLNGGRGGPLVPRTPEELAADAVAVGNAGADELHVHPRDSTGAETLDVDAAVAAIRAAVDLPVGVSTGAWIAGDRLGAIRAWTALPDYASVNLGEDGWRDVADALLDRGIGVEAGVWTAGDAQRLADSGLLDRCLRILVEPMDADVDGALRTVDAIEAVLGDAGPPRLLHGQDATAWPVLAEARSRGLDTRIGLEDVLVRPDGATATGNAELVRLASGTGSTAARG